MSGWEIMMTGKTENNSGCSDSTKTTTTKTAESVLPDVSDGGAARGE